MKTLSFPISVPGGDARLDVYLLDNTHLREKRTRPFVLFFPGGGYEFTSEREGEPLAVKFLAEGCNAAVLWYSVGDVRFPVALTQALTAVAIIRDHAEEWCLNKLAVAGGSAGGHLAASVGMLWDQPFLSALVSRPSADLKPDALILSYPVITAEIGTGGGCIDRILGEKKNDPAARALVSLEKQVKPTSPPAFVWTTFDDPVVPAAHSLLLANAYWENKASLELHIFPHGPHGLARADYETASAPPAIQPEVAEWMPMAVRWLKSLS